MNIKIKTAPDFKAVAARVGAVGIAGNMFLSIFKAVAGLLSGSGSLISDAVHSAADVFSNIVVLIGIRLSAKKPDREHPYGHERFECVAAAVLGIILLVTGLFIGISACEQILSNDFGSENAPKIYAVIAAAVSLVIKEFLFRFTKFYGIKYNSQALLADAYHHRADVLATLGALVGTVGAKAGMPILDSIASIGICILIIRTAVKILFEAARKMIDRSCDDETQENILNLLKTDERVFDAVLRTRLFGNKIYAEATVFVSPDTTVMESFHLSTELSGKVNNVLPQIKEISVWVAPK
ncbi:MAG: cation transporter [Clostridia bacterium]|nr:cation transporter [Clostridia bacterium]